MDSESNSAPGASPRATTARTEQRHTDGGPGSIAGPSPRPLRVPTDTAMRELGRELAGRLRAGDLVILSGPLGAGKTTLVQGIGEGLGVGGPGNSPTFVIA